RVHVERAWREHEAARRVLVLALEAVHELVGCVHVARGHAAAFRDGEERDAGARLWMLPQGVDAEPGRDVLPPGRIQRLDEDLLGLTTDGSVTEHAARAVARGHAGDEELVAVDPTIRPRPGRRLFHLRTRHSRHLHGVAPFGGARGLYCPP